MSRIDYSKVIELLGMIGTNQNSLEPPKIGSNLYCRGNIPDVIAGAGILDFVCENFKVFIEKHEFEKYQKDIIENDKNISTIKWIDELLSRISLGIQKNTYQLIPPMVFERGKDVSGSGPLSQSLLTMMSFKGEHGDDLPPKK
jgi:hypothetical protein